jgi:uracil-DNA glycosylase family 4
MRCDKCHLCYTASHVRIDARGTGNFILFVGEAPGKTENQKGQCFIGTSGQRLDELITLTKIKPEWCSWTNIIRCIPWMEGSRYKTRQPAEEEIDACRSYLEAEILRIDPVYIVPLGVPSTNWFINTTSLSKARRKRHEVEFPSLRFRYAKFLRWRDLKGLDWPTEHTDAKRRHQLEKAEKEGFPHLPTKKFTVWPTYHPAASLHSGDQNYEQCIIEDLSYLRYKITKDQKVPWGKYKLLSSLDDIAKVYDYCKQRYRNGEIEGVAIDTETTSLNPFLCPYGELLLFSFTDVAGRAWSVPYNHPESPFWRDDMSLRAVSNLTNDFLQEVPIIGHNIKFDFLWLNKAGIVPKKIAGDTMLASYTLFNDATTHGLETLVTRYAGMITHKEEMHYALRDVANWHKLESRYLNGQNGKALWGCKVADDDIAYRERHMGDLPLDLVHRYCCADADGTLRLHLEFNNQLHEEGLFDPHYEVSVPAVIPVARMEIDGVRVDFNRFEEVKKELKEKLAGLYSWFDQRGYVKQIYDVRCEVSKKPPKEIKVGYWMNRAILLFDILKLPLGLGGEDKKDRCTDKEVMQDIRSHCLESQQTAKNSDEREYWTERLEVVDKSIAYAIDEKTLTSWVEKIPPNCDDAGIGHANFGIRTTETFRLKVKDHPNWHGIKRGSIVKNCVIPLNDLGLILIADYNQMELRGLANYCGDERMIQAFRDGKDIHRFVSSVSLGKPEDAITKAERQQMKAVSLGVGIGGRGPGAVADQLNVSKHKAQEIIDVFLDAFPLVRDYHQQQRESVVAEGCLYSEFKFRRKFPKNKYEKHDLERRGINNPIQSTAGDITTVAMSNISNSLQRRKTMHSTIWATVHDSICFSVWPGEIYPLLLLTWKMMVDLPAATFSWLKVPLKADFEVGITWGNTCTFELLDNKQVKVHGKKENFLLLKDRMESWEKPPGLVSGTVERYEEDKEPHIRSVWQF